MILEKITTIELPAIKKFVVKDHFVEGNKEVSIGFVSNNFKKQFYDKIERDVPKQTLAISILRETAFDKNILSELGKNSNIHLAHVWELLNKQPHGEDGILLTNGYANIFYSGDELWAVNCRWYSDDRHWGADAYPVTDPFGWGDGGQVISRDYYVFQNKPLNTLNLEISEITINGKRYKLER